MATGTVKNFDAARGFGFIAPDDGRDDVFVHISNVESSSRGYLDETQGIRFDIEADGRGPRAVNLSAVAD